MVQFSLSLKRICTFFPIVPCLLCMKLLLDNKSPHNPQQPLWIILIDDRSIVGSICKQAACACAPLTLNKGAGILNLIVSLAEEILLQPTGHT
jgi:hypothetical protein